MSKFQSVKGSTKSGFRDTHGKKSLPSGASSDPAVPGGSAGGGMGKGGENVRGNAGNASKGSL